MLFAGREVRIEKNCALGLFTDLGLWSQSLTQDLGHSFLNTANNIYIFHV